MTSGLWTENTTPLGRLLATHRHRIAGARCFQGVLEHVLQDPLKKLAVCGEFTFPYVTNDDSAPFGNGMLAVLQPQGIQ